MAEGEEQLDPNDVLVEGNRVRETSVDSIRMIHFADIHIGMENYGSVDPKTGVNARVVDFLTRFDELVDPIAHGPLRDADSVRDVRIGGPGVPSEDIEDLPVEVVHVPFQAALFLIGFEIRNSVTKARLIFGPII